MADAAWLPDPTGRFQYRYWDGSAWSAAVSRQGSQETDALSTQPPPPPSSTQAPPPPPPVSPSETVSVSPPAWPGTAPAWPGTATAWSSPSPGATAAPTEWSPGLRVAVVVSVGVLALGSCLNWVKASAGGFTVTRGGLYGDGKLTLGLAVIVAVLFFVVSQKKVAAGLTIAGGVLAALIAFYDIGDIKKRAADLSTSSVGVSATIGIGLILCAIAGVALVIAGIVGVSEARRT
jgi:hypothetical protein